MLEKLFLCNLATSVCVHQEEEKCPEHAVVERAHGVVGSNVGCMYVRLVLLELTISFKTVQGRNQVKYSICMQCS